MVSRKTPLALGKGAEVFREGDPVEHFYVVTAGMLEVRRETRLAVPARAI